VTRVLKHSRSVCSNLHVRIQSHVTHYTHAHVNKHVHTRHSHTHVKVFIDKLTHVHTHTHTCVYHTQIHTRLCKKLCKETNLLHKQSYYHTHALPSLSTCKSVRQVGHVGTSRFISTRSFHMFGAHCQLRPFILTTIHSLKRPAKEAYILSHTCTHPIHRVDDGLHCVLHHHTLHRQLIVELLQRFGCL